MSTRRGSPGGSTSGCWTPDDGSRPEGWVGPICSGCTATMALPALAPGTYEVFAYSSDGAASPFAGPVALTV